MTTNNDAMVRLSIKQDLTVGNVTEVLDSCERELAERPAGAVALDLCGASFLDSIGTSAVIQLYKQCQEQGRSFSVEVDSAQLRRIFQHSGLDVLLNVCLRGAAG
ncbi:STAS domain-containing protein [Candidatus Sumerlaeota bacterium]